MQNRHKAPQNDDGFDLTGYFKNPASPRQKQYEAVRAVTVKRESVKTVAEKFGYKINTIYSLIRDAKAGVVDLFPRVSKGPKQRRTPVPIQDKIVLYRKEGFSTADIQQRLAHEDISISARTVERILKDAGFGKLKRRTNKQLGKTKKNKLLPKRAEPLDFSRLKPFDVDCPTAGIFFLIPYILQTKILEVLKECKLPQSSDIGSIQACLSVLLLKLIGGKRLSHIDAYDQQSGLGVFAGLNVLPKSTYMTTYSCRCSETELIGLQEKVVHSFQQNDADFYQSAYINLDFHSIPHYGDEGEMEKVWCGAKGKTIKGANTVFAQDSQSNTVLYTRADILRSEEAQEVKKFVAYWKKIKGKVEETFVFDCKFTTYKVLDELDEDNIKFITLRKRHAALVRKTAEIPSEEWKKVYIPIPKRKHKHVSVHEKEVKLSGCKNSFRQITVKDHGRLNPTFILTNNQELSLKDVLEVYAKRWRVENKLAELVGFFNLNALSSPIMIRIHFDILWTMVADTLYHLFAQDLRRFEKTLAPTIFRQFIDMPGRVIYDGEKFLVKIRKRSHTPILKGIEKLQNPFPIPWLDNKTMEIVWTA
jgi:transposase